jgi:hypothetical protein
LKVHNRQERIPIVKDFERHAIGGGIGDEFVPACDMRFASRQGALFGNPRSASDWSRAAELLSGSRV